jgi:dihydrofolate reductase
MKALVAISKNGMIGNQNRLPWHIPEDLKFFKQATIGHIVIMGRNTFESLPTYGLKDRISVVLTSRPFTHIASTNEVIFTTIENLDETLKTLQLQYPTKTVFVIGGKSIYKLFENNIEEFIVTHIHKYVVGDVSMNTEFLDSRQSSILDHWYCDKEECEVSRVSYTIFKTI